MPDEYVLYLVAGMRGCSDALALSKRSKTRIEVKWANTEKVIPPWLNQIPSLYHHGTSKVWTGQELMDKMESMAGPERQKIPPKTVQLPVLPGYALYSEKQSVPVYATPRPAQGIPTYSSYSSQQGIPSYSSGAVAAPA